MSYRDELAAAVARAEAAEAELKRERSKQAPKPYKPPVRPGRWRRFGRHLWTEFGVPIIFVGVIAGLCLLIASVSWTGAAWLSTGDPHPIPRPPLPIRFVGGAPAYALLAWIARGLRNAWREAK